MDHRPSCHVKELKASENNNVTNVENSANQQQQARWKSMLGRRFWSLMLIFFILFTNFTGVAGESSGWQNADPWAVFGAVGTWLFGFFSVCITLQGWWHSKKMRLKKNAELPTPICGRFRIPNALLLRNTLSGDQSSPETERPELHVTFFSDDPLAEVVFQNLKSASTDDCPKKLGEIAHVLIPGKRVLKGNFRHAPGCHITAVVIYQSGTDRSGQENDFNSTITLSENFSTYPVSLEGVRDSDGMNIFMSGLGKGRLYTRANLIPIPKLQGSEQTFIDVESGSKGPYETEEEINEDEGRLIRIELEQLESKLKKQTQSDALLMNVSHVGELLNGFGTDVVELLNGFRTDVVQLLNGFGTDCHLMTSSFTTRLDQQQSSLNEHDHHIREIIVQQKNDVSYKDELRNRAAVAEAARESAESRLEKAEFERLALERHLQAKGMI